MSFILQLWLYFGFYYIGFLQYCSCVYYWCCRCWSFLGRVGGPQPLSLQTPACMWSGIASHELMHVLGFVHEQSRSDRDRYVTILWENIIEGLFHDLLLTTITPITLKYFLIISYFLFSFSLQVKSTTLKSMRPTI